MKPGEITNFSSPRVYLPALVISVFAVIGVIKLVYSKAATSNYVGFYNASSVSNPSAAVFDTTDAVGGIGVQNVTDIAPGGKMIYSNFPGKTAASTICYYVHIYNSPKASVQVSSAKIQVVGFGNNKTLSLPADTNYHKVCVPKGSDNQLPFNVYNMSPQAFVLVYQAVAEF